MEIKYIIEGEYCSNTEQMSTNKTMVSTKDQQE